MMKRLKSERRLYPRVQYGLPLKVAVNGYAFETTSQDISCVGAYCRINKYVPPFTKVSIRLSLPIKNSKSQNNSNVECKGVIVRADDKEDINGFNIAIFFNEINDTQRNKISRYVNQLLSQGSPAA